jgi:Arc/MetJ family transcription regulator
VPTRCAGPWHIIYAAIYHMYMRTVVDIDDEALARAAAELGTTTKRDTINSALRYVAERRERAAQYVAATHLFGDPKGLDDPEVMQKIMGARGRRS